MRVTATVREHAVLALGDSSTGLTDLVSNIPYVVSLEPRGDTFTYTAVPTP